MTSLEHLDAGSLQRWLDAAVDALERTRAEINSLNVFPVPDHDTGNNLHVTMRAAADAAVTSADAGAAEVAGAAGRGALAAACGSSGVIMAAYLRGFAEGLAGRAQVDGPTLAAALAGAAESASAAVSDPIDGTILSVARAAALAAGKEDSGPVGAVIGAAAAAARAELAETRARVPALAAAGLVDAGGRGLVVVLEALSEVATGVTCFRRDSNQRPVERMHAPGLAFAYEVQYLFAGSVTALPTLRERLEAIGDSVALAAGDDTHSVHVHVNDVGAAIEAALDLGRPSAIRVTHFNDQFGRGGD